MADTNLFYYSPALGKTNPRELVLQWQITGAKAVASTPMGAPVYAFFDAIASQSTIDNFLGTVSEFTTAQFDSTTMGNDAFGCLVNMGGQVAQVISLDISCFSASNTEVKRFSIATGLTDSTLGNEIGLGAYGNLAFHVDFGNTPDFDGLTAGRIEATICWISK